MGKKNSTGQNCNKKCDQYSSSQLSEICTYFKEYVAENVFSFSINGEIIGTTAIDLIIKARDNVLYIKRVSNCDDDFQKIDQLIYVAEPYVNIVKVNTSCKTKISVIESKQFISDSTFKVERAIQANTIIYADGNVVRYIEHFCLNVSDGDLTPREHFLTSQGYQKCLFEIQQQQPLIVRVDNIVRITKQT
jgi:hypothetical protein